MPHISRRRLVLLWTLSGSAAVLAAALVYLLLVQQVLAEIFGYPAAFLAGHVALNACIGASLGLAQHRVLRRRMNRVGWWWPATFAGMTIGAYLGFAPMSLSVTLASAFLDYGTAAWVMEGVSAGLTGVTVGAAQWLVLKRRVVMAVWWVPTNAVAWGIGLLTIGWILNLPGVIGLSGHGPGWGIAIQALSQLLLGGAVGLISGFVLSWMLDQRPPTQTAP